MLWFVKRKKIKREAGTMIDMHTGVLARGICWSCCTLAWQSTKPWMDIPGNMTISKAWVVTCDFRNHEPFFFTWKVQKLPHPYQDLFHAWSKESHSKILHCACVHVCVAGFLLSRSTSLPTIVQWIKSISGLHSRMAYEILKKRH